MAKIHMVLQGKGGVGKSFIAAMLAQYKARKGQIPLCIDTDPVNATFHGYKALTCAASRSWMAMKSTRATSIRSSSSLRRRKAMSLSTTARARLSRCRTTL
jgi:CO dehydrogenase nickel-insertion accessory protein CooC1